MSASRDAVITALNEIEKLAHTGAERPESLGTLEEMLGRLFAGQAFLAAVIRDHVLADEPEMQDARDSH